MSGVVYRSGKVTVREDGRNPGRYRITWVDGSGRQRERSGGRDLAGAKRLADETAGAAAAGAVDQSGATVNSLVEGWLVTIEHREQNSRDQHDSLARNHIRTEIGTTRCRDLTPDAAQRVLSEMTSRGYAHATRRDVAAILRSLGRYGVKVGAWTPDRNPLADVRVGRRKRGERDATKRVDPKDIPTQAEVLDLCDHIEDLSPVWALGGRIIDATGLRWQEVAALHVDVIDLDEQLVHIVEALHRIKGRTVLGPVKSEAAERSIPLNDDITERITAWLRDNDPVDGRLFWGPNGGIPHARNVHRRVLEPARELSIYPDHCAWHSIRHATATRWCRSGSIETASKLLGHSNPAFTMARYVGTASDHLDRARSIV